VYNTKYFRENIVRTLQRFWMSNLNFLSARFQVAKPSDLHCEAVVENNMYFHQVTLKPCICSWLNPNVAFCELEQEIPTWGTFAYPKGYI